ncbi:MAG TPA: TetR/AcrR family transcriptional regulator [Solirubrobacteraceae bacterium]|jgi:AcrR family transcriptional regulator|nr:TetR/AcrR family transcriptional regulator [Solirubrobacteraceae bacterium]
MTGGRALQPRRTPVQERSTVTVEAILQAAAQVFERQGYAAGTTNRIAERAGVSIGTLCQYFPNKDAILVALIDRHLREGERILAPLIADLVVGQPPAIREALDRVLGALLELHAQQPGLHRVLFEEAPRPPQVRDELERNFAQATAALAHYLCKRPEITVEDTRLAAQLVVQTLDAITHGLVIHPRAQITPEAYVAETALMRERYLTGE